MCIRRRKQWRQELLESLESPGHAQDQVHDRLLCAVPLVDSTVVRLFVQKAFIQIFQSPVTRAAFICPSCLPYADDFVCGSYFLAP